MLRMTGRPEQTDLDSCMRKNSSDVASVDVRGRTVQCSAMTETRVWVFRIHSIRVISVLGLERSCALVPRGIHANDHNANNRLRTAPAEEWPSEGRCPANLLRIEMRKCSTVAHAWPGCGAYASRAAHPSPSRLRTRGAPLRSRCAAAECQALGATREQLPARPNTPLSLLRGHRK
jgi:hypothetical protein